MTLTINVKKGVFKMSQYGIFFTQAGRTKIANATVGDPLTITHIAVGDGGGGYPAIDDSVTSLVNELGRYPISGTGAPVPTQRQFSANVDSSIGPAVIRERGLIDSDGDLIAIAQTSPISIPDPASPEAIDIIVSILVTFNNADFVKAVVELQSYVHSNRKVNAGSGLEGGGDLTEDRTLDVKFGDTAGTAAEGNHKHDAADITSGVLDIERIPVAALERLVIVADDTARFALTKATVQDGDTVKVESSGKMYFVVDDTKLNNEAGYNVYTAGSASSVPWSGVTDKPLFGSSSTRDVGTTAGTVAAGNDSRLSDSREWAAATISKAEVEAGEAETRRAFTAQRLRQGIVAWFNGVSGTIGRAILGRNTAAQVRGDLELGTAAIRDVGGANGDVLSVAAFGLVGTSPVSFSGSSFEAQLTRNMMTVQRGSGAAPSDSPESGAVKALALGDIGIWESHLAISAYGNRLYLRSRASSKGPFLPWVQIHHTGNILGATGNSTQYPMTQKATTDAINASTANTAKTNAANTFTQNQTINGTLTGGYRNSGDGIGQWVFARTTNTSVMGFRIYSNTPHGEPLQLTTSTIAGSTLEVSNSDGVTTVGMVDVPNGRSQLAGTWQCHGHSRGGDRSRTTLWQRIA